MQDLPFFVQYASEKWINHSCLNHRRLFSLQLSTTENAVGEKWSSAVCAVITTWSPTHTIYTAVRERGEFSKHAVSDELYSRLLLKLRIGKTVEPWSHLIVKSPERKHTVKNARD